MSYLNPQDAERYRTLRERAERGDTLSAAENQEWLRLEQLWNAADSEHLGRAARRVQVETAALAAHNIHLKALLERKQRLADRLDAMLSELRQEQQTMDAEIARLLTPTEAAHFASAARP